MLNDGQALTDIAIKNAARLRVRTKRLNIALIGSHVAVVLGIVGVIILGYKAPVEASSAQSAHSILEQPTNSVDQIAAANVASSVAQTLDLSVESNVQNLAVSLNAKTELAQTDTAFLTKPQIVQQNSGRKGITPYTTKAGDSVQSIAAAFGVSEDSVRWANSLTSDSLNPGRNLQIPGVTGVVYTLKAGDEIAKLAEKYRADTDRIVTYNDLELTGPRVGLQIVIPDGVVPETERPGYRAPASRYGSATVSTMRVGAYAGNGYAHGYCTWYAYNRRAEIGRPIGGNWGNATSWAYYARADGFRVDRTPEVGAIIQNGGSYGGLGHVGIVERINDDGSLLVSDMNWVGWGKISTRTVPASSVGNFNYIR